MGLITQAVADYMNTMYPHYVPAFVNTAQGVSGITGKAYNISVKDTIKKAKGSRVYLELINRKRALKALFCGIFICFLFFSVCCFVWCGEIIFVLH